MGKSNLDKFLEIESMMDEVKALMIPYEEALEERYEYMNDLRREDSNLSHTLERVEQRLHKQSYEEELEERYESMNDLRREYSNLSHTLERVEQSLKKQSNDLEEDEDVKTVVKASLTKLDGHIEALEEENHYGEQNEAVKQLKR